MRFASVEADAAAAAGAPTPVALGPDCRSVEVFTYTNGDADA